MTVRLNIGLTAAIASLQVAGCFSDSMTYVDGEDVGGPVIWPMAVGNFWEFEEEVSGTPAARRIEVGRSIRLPNGSDGYVLNRIQAGQSAPVVESVFANDDGGFYVIGAFSGADTLTQKMLYYPFPAELGDQGHAPGYKFISEDNSDLLVVDSTQFTVTNMDTTVATSVGNFHCYEYTHVLKGQGEADDSIVHEYYAPNFGPVKMIIRSESRPRTEPNSVYTLSRYRVHVPVVSL